MLVENYSNSGQHHSSRMLLQFFSGPRPNDKACATRAILLVVGAHASGYVRGERNLMSFPVAISYNNSRGNC